MSDNRDSDIHDAVKGLTKDIAKIAGDDRDKFLSYNHDGQDFGFQEIVNGLTKASQKITENYLDNFSSYNHDIRDIFFTYAHFFTKLSVSPLELIKVQDYYFNFLLNQQDLWRKIFFRSDNEE